MTATSSHIANGRCRCGMLLIYLSEITDGVCYWCSGHAPKGMLLR